MSGKTVKLKDGRDYRVEDWWDRLGQGSWMFCKGNMACIQYALKYAFTHAPVDDEVLYGKIGPFGHLMHVSQLDL